MVPDGFLLAGRAGLWHEGRVHPTLNLVAFCLGVITATFGGVLRDIARAEVPLIFRREIHATACIIGGSVRTRRAAGAA